MLPKEWDGTVAQLAAFSEKLTTDFPNNDQQGYAAWRNGAVEKLPAGVFVWRNEFENDFHRAYSKDSPGGYLFVEELERPGDRDLNFTPMLSSEVRKMVLEGFEIINPVETPKTGTLTWEEAAKALAATYLSAWRNAGFEPTGEDAALYVEGEFYNKEIYGVRGEILDRATIKRQALAGITGHPRGYKSKKPKVPTGKSGKMPEK